MTASTIGPIAPQERIQTIDIIRAVALFGVVVANFTVDNGGVTPASGRTGFLDQLCYWPIRFFIDYKAPIQNAIKKSQNTIAVDSNILDSYVGIYQFTGTQRVVTRVRNNVFWGDVEGSHRDRLVAESETNFMNPSSNSRISFIKDSA